MTITPRPIEIDGKHYVDVIMDGHDKRYGPYAGADEAEAMARKFAAVYRLFRGGDWPAAPAAAKRRP